MSTKKAITFLDDQKIFYILGSSKLRLGLSWKNKDQVYELECQYCQAVYSDSITSNLFAPARKGTMTEESFLTCKNCGVSQATSDDPIKFKKTSFEYNVGPVPFPKKMFEVLDAYKGAPEVVPKDIAALACYKELPIDDSPEPELCGCDVDECPDCYPPLGPIYLNVTDALIVSGLNPYEPNKRERLVEFYASKRLATQHDYINFNKKYNGDKRKKEKEVLANVDVSTLIKAIAEKAQFGDNRDEYALEPITNTLDALGIEVWENGTSITTIDERTNTTVTVKAEESGTITLVREDGCVKTGTISQDGCVVDSVVDTSVDQTTEMSDDEKKIFESYVNKTTGCKSEVNIHEHLKEIFDGYEHGQIPVNGVIDGVHYNGLIDGIIRAEYGFGGDSNSNVIRPVVKGCRPVAIFEIKKRMKQIFSMEELIERKYDLCQIVLYKILTNQGATGDPTKLVIVQSFDQDIEILRVSTETQKLIFEQFQAGMTAFKTDIKKLKKF